MDSHVLTYNFISMEQGRKDFEKQGLKKLPLLETPTLMLFNKKNLGLTLQLTFSHF